MAPLVACPTVAQLTSATSPVASSTPAKHPSYVEVPFDGAMEIANRSFKDLEKLDSDDDEAKDVNDVPVACKPARNSSATGSIACNRPVRSSSVRSQKLVSDYFRNN